MWVVLLSCPPPIREGGAPPSASSPLGSVASHLCQLMLTSVRNVE